MALQNKRSKLDTNIIAGNDAIYMDYNATTPLAPSVVDIIQQSLTTAWGNPSSAYPSGVQAKKLIETSRQQITAMLNGSRCSEVTFMSGGTEANNHVIWSAIKYFHERNAPNCVTKPHFITSNIEHDSILCLLNQLKQDGIIDVSYLPVSKELGCVDNQKLLDEIKDETVLISIMMANNETGVVQPIAEICQSVRELNKTRQNNTLPEILLHTDAAQAIGKISVDVKTLGVNYLTIVGHKFYGPRIGALWIEDGSPFYPMLFGGGQEKGKRPGTENTCMIAGLGEAARLVHENLLKYNQHFTEICGYLQTRLSEVFGDNISFNCYTPENLPNTLNVSFNGINSNGRQILKQCHAIEASVGAACHSNDGDNPSSILLAHHVPLKAANSAIRLSIGRSTSRNDVDLVVADLKQSFKRIKQDSL